MIVFIVKPYFLTCLPVVSAVRRAATSRGRVTAGTPRRWPRPFRSTTTHWPPCISPEASTFLGRPPTSVLLQLDGGGCDCSKDIISQRGVTATLCNLKPANSLCPAPSSSVLHHHGFCPSFTLHLPRLTAVYFPCVQARRSSRESKNWWFYGAWVEAEAVTRSWRWA